MYCHVEYQFIRAEHLKHISTCTRAGTHAHLPTPTLPPTHRHTHARTYTCVSMRTACSSALLNWHPTCYCCCAHTSACFTHLAPRPPCIWGTGACAAVPGAGSSGKRHGLHSAQQTTGYMLGYCMYEAVVISFCCHLVSVGWQSLTRRLPHPGKA